MLWWRSGTQDPTLSFPAQTALEAAFNRGSLVVAAPVFAELLAAPGRTESFVGSFLEETGIALDWELGEAAWRSAGARSKPTRSAGVNNGMPTVGASLLIF
jgi:hypothetical protein